MSKPSRTSDADHMWLVFQNEVLQLLQILLLSFSKITTKFIFSFAVVPIKSLFIFYNFNEYFGIFKLCSPD